MTLLLVIETAVFASAGLALCLADLVLDRWPRLSSRSVNCFILGFLAASVTALAAAAILMMVL